jgi:hypothetical protein
VRIVVDESDDDVPRLFPLGTLNLSPLAEPNPLQPPIPRHRDRRNRALQLANRRPHATHIFHETRPFTFIVHRRTLVARIPRAQLACAPFRSVHGTAPTVVSWSEWGVPVTRWFESDPASIRWITTTAGQRAVTMEENTPTPIIVRDFNPYAVRAALAREKSRILPNGNKQTLKAEEGVIPAGSMFREDVRSALPYIETVTQTRYGYEGVLIDEERILGLEVRSLSWCPRAPHLAIMLIQYVSQTNKDDEIEISSFDVHVLG